MSLPKLTGEITLDRQKILTIPNATGVYLFIKKDARNKTSEILYAGKALNLKARLLSHLENAKLDKKEATMIQNSNYISYYITDSEFKALFLESELIQKFHPKYNTRWKDDKSYLYIKITVKDEFPKIFPVRKENDHKSLYFGPFTSNRDVNIVLKEIRRIFPFCAQKNISKQPCFYSKIGLCKPCPNEINKMEDSNAKKTNKKEYKSNIGKIVKVFKGETEKVESDLYKKLQIAKQNDDYERAITLRNKLFGFQILIRQQLFHTFNNLDYQGKNQVVDLLQLLHFYLPKLVGIKKIECYDISSLSQKEATASMVVFSDGIHDKKEYKRFKIQNLNIKSDFAMLDEVIRRRFSNNWPEPDLIVVDGGKPQVRTVMSTLAKINKQLPVIGIAKGPDRLVIGSKDLPTIRPKINNLGFNLVRYIRDESHRFAKKYHLLLRTKRLYNKV